jgi:4-amino-4-deoxy-L-arabinose transferase-like glycosyltransferase
MRIKLSKTKKELVLLLFVFLIAAFLRTYKVRDLTTFSADQGRDALIIKKILVDYRFTLLGPKTSISDVHLGPIYYYLLLPFFWIFKLDPIAGSIMTIIFDLGTLLLIFYFVKSFINPQSAIFALFLYSISLQVIEFSRIALNPFITPFFSILALFSLTKIFIKEKSKFFIPLYLSLAVLIQLHYLNFPFIFLIFLISLVKFFDKRTNKKKLLLGILLGLLVILPFIAFEFRHQFFNTQAFLTYVKSSGSTFNFKDSILNLLSLTASDFALNQTQSAVPILLIACFLIISLFHLKKNQKLIIFILLMTLFVEVFFASFIKENLASFYFICLQPGIFILIAIIINFLYQKMKIFGLTFFLILIITSIANLDYHRKNGYTMPEGWNMIGVQKASSIIAQDVETKNFNVAATLDGDTRATPYRYFLEAIYKKPPLDVIQYPEAEVLYVISRSQEKDVLANPVWEISSFNPKKLEKKWHLQNQIFLYKLKKLNIKDIDSREKGW